MPWMCEWPVTALIIYMKVLITYLVVALLFNSDNEYLKIVTGT